METKGKSRRGEEKHKHILFKNYYKPAELVLVMVFSYGPKRLLKNNEV